MSREYDQAGNPVYCSGSGKQTASEKWARVFCAECHDPEVLVNADGRLRKHFRLWPREKMVAKGWVAE